LDPKFKYAINDGVKTLKKKIEDKNNQKYYLSPSPHGGACSSSLDILISANGNTTCMCAKVEIWSSF
jgi:hypothetical protein